MPTRQRDDEDLTEYTKHFKATRDLCKEKYGGIFTIPMLAQKESTWGSDLEGCYKTAYASLLSILYLKNMDQCSMVHSSRRWEKTLPQVRRTSTQSILRMCSIFCPSINMTKLIMISRTSNKMIMTKGCMSSKNDDCSTTGNVPNIVEMSFTQMEGSKVVHVPRMSQKDNDTWTR